MKEALEARGRRLTYYRHPFLFTGPTPEIKQGMQAYLDGRGYRVAPVTLDNADYQDARALPTRVDTVIACDRNTCPTWSLWWRSSKNGPWKWWGGSFRRSCSSTQTS